MNKKDKLSVSDVVKGSAYDKVRAILRETTTLPRMMMEDVITLHRKK